MRVSPVDPPSPAGQEGLQAGEVILEIDRRRSAGEFESLASRASGDVLLRIYRDGATLFVVLTPLRQGGR